MSIFFADCAAVCAYLHQSSKNAHMQTAKGLKVRKGEILCAVQTFQSGELILNKSPES